MSKSDWLAGCSFIEAVGAAFEEWAKSPRRLASGSIGAISSCQLLTVDCSSAETPKLGRAEPLEARRLLFAGLVSLGHILAVSFVPAGKVQVAWWASSGAIRQF